MTEKHIREKERRGGKRGEEVGEVAASAIKVNASSEC